MKVHKGIGISKYNKLTSYLKIGSRNYKPKKAMTLEGSQIEELKKVQNEQCLPILRARWQILKKTQKNIKMELQSNKEQIKQLREEMQKIKGEWMIEKKITKP